MSEIVQRHMESMTEEFEEMVRTKLYSQEEIRVIKKRRFEFEYKIHGVTKNAQDFKNYIRYDLSLLQNIRLRRDKLRVAQKKSSLEHKVIKRIKSLYEMAIERFSNDISFSLRYIKFCKQVNYINAASFAIQNMLKMHQQNPEVWQIAAKWHTNDRKDISAGLNILHKGLAIHKDSQLLYTEAIELVLLDVTTSENSQDDRSSKKQIGVEKLSAYLKAIFENIFDYKYYITVLELLEPHKFTVDVQKSIIDRLLKTYSDKSFVWHMFAQRERKGIYLIENQEHANTSTKARLSFCFAKYEEGLLKVPASEKKELWSLYLDCLIELSQDNLGVASEFKIKSLNSALEKACAEKCLMEKYYMKWMEIVKDGEKLKVLEKGMAAFPQSVDLWSARLQYQILEDVPLEVNQVFKQGIKILEGKSLPLWMAVIRYHLLTSSDKVIKSIYEGGVEQPKEVSDVLKPKYIEWLVYSEGIKVARQVYNTLARQKPYCRELHRVMSRMEGSELNYDFRNWVKVYQLACEQFGREEVEVWVNYIEFYLRYNNKVENLNGLIIRIYKEAENALDPSLMMIFIDKFNSLNENASVFPMKLKHC